MSGFQLGPKAQAAGFRLVAFDSVGSTSSEALTAVANDDPGNVWFVALEQTAGRGRRGRPWETAHGNLAASLLLRPDADPSVVAGLGFVAGVALNRALADCLPDAHMKTGLDGADAQIDDSPVRIALKWPNDVLADGAKLAGIMLEAQSVPDGRQAIVIGIGVNVVAAPQNLPYPAVSIAELNVKTDATHIHEALAEHWVDVYALWNNGAGIGDVLALWRQSAAGIGAPVAISTHGEVLRGVFDSIDDTGRLIVKTDDGRLMPIAAGDVHFGTTASVR